MAKTTTTAHTPGPWWPVCLSEVTGQWAVDGPDRKPVAWPAHDCREDGEEEANTHLIAAAPDLLEALEAALTALDDSDQDRFDGGTLTGRIRAAIAKARGES